MSQGHSPLFMVMDDPVLNRLINYLAAKKAEQEESPDRHVKIELSREFISSIREAFRRKILDGERHLHVLSHLLSSILFEGDFELHSNVIGVLPGDDERPFHIRERVMPTSLFSFMDIDLGNQMLDNFRYRRGRDWVALNLSANFIEYVPVGRPSTNVNRITSRVKAEEELWNKVADELFQIDQLVNRDKHLKQYSKFIKDVFGIKIVCEDEASCVQVHEDLQEATVSTAEWDNLESLIDLGMLEDGRPSSDQLLAFIETKDYLNCPEAERKRTGWRALKSVAIWRDRLFEIQVQPLSNYFLELDHMSGPSHSSFKLQRDAMRHEVARRVPLYGFYRNLLRMLFVETEISFECEYASVVIS